VHATSPSGTGTFTELVKRRCAWSAAALEIGLQDFPVTADVDEARKWLKVCPVGAICEVMSLSVALQ
jgi:hypothetical protein